MKQLIICVCNSSSRLNGVDITIFLKDPVWRDESGIGLERETVGNLLHDLI